jgi:hypothetical protein
VRSVMMLLVIASVCQLSMHYQVQHHLPVALAVRLRKCFNQQIGSPLPCFQTPPTPYPVHTCSLLPHLRMFHRPPGAPPRP